jgi:solute carrier family 25 folate transporter 32
MGCKNTNDGKITFLMLQTQSSSTLYYYNSTLHALKTMIKKEGIKALYKGFIPSLVGIAHPTIQFPLYERFKIIISRMNHLLIINRIREEL